MQRVLMISADPAQVAVAEAAMRVDGRTLRAETSAEGCLLAVREWRPDLLILDLGVGLTSAGVAALLRDPVVADGLPVLALTEHDQLRDVGAGVSIDDFIMAPIDEDELRARVSRVLWRRTGADDGHLLRRGSLVIDLERYTVTVSGAVVDLTFKEYELLRFLASNPGKPFTREALLNQVWGYDYYGGSRTVDVHVRRIRAKIERHETFIETVRNVGYRFADEPRGS
jgi:two-component system alkaline phosphatase synthesis response regulator PhoP